MMILDLDSKQKKKKGAQFFERDEDLTEEWVLRHQAFLVEEMRTKITKKFEKDNEKLVGEKKKPLPDKELKERLKAVKELETKFKKENKSKKVEAEGKGASVDKFETQIGKIDERIKNLEAQSADREGNKEVALGTSKIVGFSPADSQKDGTDSTSSAELHRPQTQRCLLEQNGCAHRATVPENTSRKVQLGDCVHRRRFRVGVLTLPVYFFKPTTAASLRCGTFSNVDSAKNLSSAPCFLAVWHWPSTFSQLWGHQLTITHQLNARLEKPAEAVCILFRSR